MKEFQLLSIFVKTTVVYVSQGFERASVIVVIVVVIDVIV